ncbi:hypothetical protein [Streptomyces xanthophaeus]|uniref:hypothetical protein n=1 Tax=Streptomyces xanthophaeus TaxID=67385 RepID=UPI0026485CF6|nr:hypothetical protein [Streptomyces xanthophaeus]
MAMGRKATRDVEDEPEKKLDLSAAQVAGSSLATVAAALFASKMGVYGTILGAGVVSVVATAGGPVIQHLFRRTGDRLRGGARPRARQVPPSRAESTGADTTAAGAVTEAFGEATVHGTRVRGWKRTAVASGAAFAVAVGGLGTYEAMAGTSVSSGGGTLFSGGTRTAGPDRPAPPRDEPGGEGKGGRGPGSGTSPSPSPSPSPSSGGRSAGPAPGPSGSGNPGASADPAPGASPSKEAPSSSPAPTAPTPPVPTAGPDAPPPAARQTAP